MTVQVHSDFINDNENDCRQKKSITTNRQIHQKNQFNTNLSSCYNQNSSITKISKSKKKSTVEDVIGNVCGPFGKWQLRTVLLIFLVKIPSSWFMACIIFTAPAPRSGEVYCKPPKQMDELNQDKDWIKISHPQIGEAADHEFKIDFCNIYQDVHDHLIKENHRFTKHHHHHEHQITSIKDLEEDLGIDIGYSRPNSTKPVIPCEEFEHHSDYESLVTQFDLVCSRDILVAVTQFFHLFGVLTGGCLATFMLKHIAPKRVMLIGMISQILCGNLTGWINSFALHNIFRCLSASCCALMYTAGSMIFSDITSGKFRVSAICLFEQFWSIGVMLLPVMASFWTSWAHLYTALSLPTILLIFTLQFIPESPRWLIKKGRVQEAKEVLINGATINGNISEIDESDLEKKLEIQSKAVMSEPKEPSWWSLWQGPGVKKNLLICHLVWSIYIIIYYGMLLNIRPFGREYLKYNTAIAGLAEIVGTFTGWSFVMFTTRKWLWAGLLNIVAALIGLSVNLVPKSVIGIERVILLMSAAMAVKIGISCTLSILTTCTTELVTPEKKRLCGYSTIVWARIWLLTAPFIGATVVFGKFIPQTIMSTMSCVGGLLTTYIESPRTIPLPDKKTNNKLDSKKQDVWTIHKGKGDGMV